MKSSLCNLRKIVSVLILLSYGIGFTDEVTSADLNGTAEKEQELQNGDVFNYPPPGTRPDPFGPFIKKGSGIKKEGSGAGSGVEPPVPSIELTLVGMILSAGGKKIAIVEDAAGKGYYLSEGTRIGNWVIRRIRDKQLEMQTTYRTKSGRIVTKERIMHLITEGDK